MKAAMATSILTTALALAAVLGGTQALSQGGNAHVGAGATIMTPAELAAQALTGHDVGYTSPTPGTFRSVFTLADIGVPDVIELHGVDSYHQVYFSVPPTEVVKTATMHIRYHFSPGLIPALSHLKVMLNGTLFATIPVVTNVDMTGIYTAGGSPTNKGTILAPQNIPIQVTRNGSSTLLEADLQMPVEMLARDNQVTFEFIGHYTLNCEDPAHSTLWSRVDATTTMTLSGDLMPLPDDLKLLPLPFFDAAVNLHPSIPVVFMSQPSNKAIQAAGIVASWFGVLTDYRVVKFPVSFGMIPSGNAIVIAEGAASLPATLSTGTGTGAGVSMRTNPNDPYGKLLVLSGDNADDLVQAAQAVSLQQSFLQGASMHIPEMDLPKVRSLNDAPRWLSTEKITPMWDLVQGETLQGDGSVPIGVYLRVPPDLYYGERRDITLRLDYRYNGIPLSNDSSLQVFMNNQYIGSTPLPHTDKAAQEAKVDVPVPVVNMRPFSNSLLLKFFFQIAKKGECEDTAPLNLQGAILKSSYLDILHIPHWIVLPNLELFANAGFPFTRRADLADTTVVLPDTPTTDELELYLALMGHFGAQTGFPALRVNVANSGDLGSVSDRDYLVLGTVQDQPALGTLGHHMPVIIDTNGVHVTDSQGFFAPLEHAWWKITSGSHVSSGNLMTTGGVPDALIEGLESPYSAGHSVVVVALKDHTVTAAFLDNFLKNSQSSDIANSVAVLHNGKFESYRIGSDVYHVGNLPLLMQISLWFTMFPWTIVLVVIFIAFFLSIWTRVWLRRRARKRLQGE
jgi:cellulose synthase (UDP-forming)